MYISYIFFVSNIHICTSGIFHEVWR